MSVKKRCPNGTRRNTKTGNCEPKKDTKPARNNLLVDIPKNIPISTKQKCPNGTRRNKKTGNCESKKDTKTTKYNAMVDMQTNIPTVDNPISPVILKNIPISTKENRQNKNRTNAKKIIQNFMLRTTQKRKSRFLKSICSDSGVCIAFGKETKKIEDFFGGFNNFQNVNGIKKIGNPSANGFILEIQYSKDNYIAHTILKNSLNKHSDNLAYEYFVGQFVNKKSKQFPCFLETYGLFLRDNNNKHDFFLNKNKLSLINNKSNEEIYQFSCKNSADLSLLIQHISNAHTLYNKLKIPDFNKNELLYILYQVYMPLMCLQNEFTHYDLHMDNVLIYEPVYDKYIQYHYFVNGKEIQFKSRYIAKIIDYGRCFFYESNANNSDYIQKQLCKTKVCNPDCGDNYGYGWLNAYGSAADYYINSSIPNVSHDLRLLDSLKTLQKMHISDDLKKVISKVQYGVGIHKDYKQFGTRPNINSGIPNKINNVADAYLMLEKLIDNHKTENDDIYKNMDKLGDLYIYSDSNKPMQFIPNK